MYIGTGTYNNSNTSFFVDDGGNFSLRDKLTFDGSTLGVNGQISASSGNIGGWKINEASGINTISSSIEIGVAIASSSLFVRDTSSAQMLARFGYFQTSDPDVVSGSFPNRLDNGSLETGTLGSNGWTTQETVYVTSSINSTDQRSDTSCYEMRFSYQFSSGGGSPPPPSAM